MSVAVFLDDRPGVELLKDDTHQLVKDGNIYAEMGREWSELLFLGFYDWLRTPTDYVIGVNLVLHDGRERLRSIIPARSYISWLAPSVVRIFFVPGEIDESASTDQEFSVSRCFQAADGQVALLFDAKELTREQLDRLSGRPLANA